MQVRTYNPTELILLTIILINQLGKIKTYAHN